MVLTSKACTVWCWSTHTFEEQNWYPLQDSKLQVEADFTEMCPLVVPSSCHFKLAWLTVCASVCGCVCVCAYVCVCVGVGGCYRPPSSVPCSSVSCNTQFLQWHSSVGQFCVPVYSAIFAWSHSGIPVYTVSNSGIPVAIQCKMDQRTLAQGEGCDCCDCSNSYTLLLDVISTDLLMIYWAEYVATNIIQYIRRNMHTVLLCFALLWLCNRS